MKSTEWIAAYKAKRQISTVYGLAKALKVSRQAAMKYESGANIPGPVVAFRIAEALGDQPAAVIAEFEAERAARDGKGEDVDDMKAWLKRIGGAAASILFAAGLGGFSNADANLAHRASLDQDIHRRKQRRWFDGLGKMAFA